MVAVFRTFSFCAIALGALFSAIAVGQESPPTAEATPANLLMQSDGAEPGLLAAVVRQLSAENRAKLGQMLVADWKDRPEWGEMLVDLLQGKDLRPPLGWYRPSEQKFGYVWLSSKFDANADGFVDKSELPQDTPDLDRVFSRLDRDLNGKLQLADFDYAGARQPTVPQVASQFLFSLLDTDSNGRATAEEWKEFFSRVDREKTDFLTTEDLFSNFTEELAAYESRTEDMPAPEKMLEMFFNGELGLWSPGPKLGDEAPDFTLPTHDGARSVTLSQCRGKPVILIFGSFT
jgi:hypothetical protein